MGLFKPVRVYKLNHSKGLNFPQVKLSQSDFAKSPGSCRNHKYSLDLVKKRPQPFYQFVRGNLSAL